jgi:hypothetical protein
MHSTTTGGISWETKSDPEKPDEVKHRAKKIPGHAEDFLLTFSE